MYGKNDRLFWTFAFLVLATLLISVSSLSDKGHLPYVGVYVKILGVLVAMVALMSSYASRSGAEELLADDIKIYILDHAGQPDTELFVLDPASGRTYFPDFLGQVRLPGGVIGRAVSIRRAASACEIKMVSIERTGQTILLDEASEDS